MFKTTRICSLILTMVMVFNLLPLQALGVTQSIGTTESDDVVTAAPSLESAEIVEEIEASRTAYSKAYRLSNGLNIAVVYGAPIHYETEDGWVEIDNTLQKTAAGTYTNTAGVWNIVLPQQMTATSPVTVTKDGYTLSFVLAGQLNQLRDTVTMTENAQLVAQNNVFVVEDETAQTYAVEAAQTATAQVQDLGVAKAKATAEHPELVSDKLTSRLLYADIYANTDVTYDLDSNKIKESVIIEEYNADLSGYKYTLNVGQLIPVLGEDGSIAFWDADKTEIVMTMPAPYLVDAAYEYNYDIKVRLDGKDGTYTLTYLLPQQWLADKDRQWPVILDPVVDATNTAGNIQDHEVAERTTVAVNRGVMEAGYGANGGIERFYIKYNELPQLGAADVIVHAQIELEKPNNYASSAVIEAHRVEADWSENTLTWSNQPLWSTDVEDFLVVEDAGTYTWDITGIVRNWYEQGNYGIMFKASDAVEIAQETKWMQFYSSDCGFSGGIPALQITYQSFSGVEDGWSYTSASAGHAGTGYVNNYTGSLTWLHGDIGFGGNRTPVSISHVYNSNDIENEDIYGTGIGWKTSLNQRVYLFQDDDQTKYYVWIDGDGTSHYMRLEFRGYVDENNPQNVFKAVKADDVYYYRLELGNGLRYFFDRYWRLSVIQDFQDTSSIIRITYPSIDSFKISTVTDGAGRKYTYNYNESGLLDHISYTGTGTTEIARVSFAYDSDGHLTDITDIDGKQSHFTYQNDLLEKAVELKGNTQVEALNLMFDYSDDGFDRVTEVKEFDGTTAGGQMELAYAHNLTTIRDAVNDITQVLRFNDYGNLISTQDELGRAQHAMYTRMDKDDAGAGNQLRLSSKLQNTVKNLMDDHSFEGRGVSTSGAAQFTNEASYMGTMSLKTTSSVSTPSFTLNKGETYTLSAWVKTEDTTAQLIIGNEGSFILDPHSEWTRLEVSYTNNNDQPEHVTPRLKTGNDANAAYMDCVQLEKMPAASRYNLLENSDLTTLSSWTTAGFGENDGLATTDTAAPRLDNKALKLTGNPEGEKSITQTLNITGSKGDAFVLAGWAKGSSVPLRGDRAFGMELTFHYTEAVSNPKQQKVDFNPDTDDGWQYAAAAIVAEEAYDSVTVTVNYDYNANTVYFDGIQLFKETFGSSYTYDENGNVVTTTDLQNQKITYRYNTNNDLTKVIMANGAELTYTYDGWHNVKTATSAEGLRYSFTYDAYGNNTKVSTTVNGKTISSKATYTAGGNYLSTVTDALNNTTIYSYDPQTGLLNWVQGPNDTEQTRTEYTYNPNTFLLESVEAMVTGDTDLSMFVNYTYEDGLLKQIETPSTLYGFNYGTFNLQKNITIGSRTLVTYNYSDDRNYYLDSIDYGNGDSVQYNYDAYGRLLYELYEDNDKVTYNYDNDGALVSVHDSDSGITSRQYYDMSGRNVGYSETADDFRHTMLYRYNSDNNLIQQVEEIDGTERTTAYTYDKDNRVTSVTTDGTTVEYTYDGFGRVSQQVTKAGETVILTEVFTYNSPKAGATSGQVHTYKTYAGAVGDSNLKAEYTYTYDTRGNITGVYNGTKWVYYAYDSANQLIREDNQRTNRTYVWIYDNAGNIDDYKVHSYAYGTETADLTNYITNTDYTYESKENGGWGDLLIGLGTQTVSYEHQQTTTATIDGVTKTVYNIGNPTQLNGRTYVWEHGRQLKSLTKGNVTWNYTYNNAGLRTSRSNGTTTYKYVYDGSLLKRMTIIEGQNREHVDFTYDTAGTPLTMTYKGCVYYYVVNLQGDVEGLLDVNGNRVLTYYYTAYGQGTYLANESNMTSELINVNPLGYRGYVHDVGTGLYYLQSRYYDPAIGRFINADGLVSTGQGFTGNNMFAYCLNNPVKLTDRNGYCSYDGTVADFIRLNQGLPPRNCTCAYATAVDNTTIRYSETDNSVTVEVSTEILCDMTELQLVKYVDLISNRISYFSYYNVNIEQGTDRIQAAQLYGEIKFHILAWRARKIHRYDESAKLTELNIYDGVVRDHRAVVNFVSEDLAKSYLKYKTNYDIDELLELAR